MDPIELPHQSPSSPPPQPSPPFVQTHHMDLLLDDEPTSVWDFGDLLDFTADDQFPISWDQPPEPECEPENPVPSDLDPDPDPDPPSIASKPSRSRKRDPRMVCSNFLAGRIPCACPELDEKMEEEELPGKKRTRTARASAGVARCQVPSCGADIRELKGYHRRHRVCLRCANAATVVLDGQRKRYCQQCGKFHILSDFDEGKRSCRRKLERHNNRRRRKPADSSRAAAKESQQDVHPDDVGCDDEDGKGDALCLSSQLGEKEASLEPEDGGVSTLRSAPESQSIPSDSVASFIVSREVPTDGAKDNVKYSLSPSCGDNRSAYSSVCPTGRISFKLYDWNPAEFPRRLRHQIFQWLASMPVELEGYIRPGCIILTVFIAMPKSMWKKLYDDPVSYIHDFIIRPGRMLSGRGTVYVYLSDMIFLVKKDGTSVVKVEVGSQVPRLHYVHPMCFEAGKPLEFVACGSDLRQPEFRFLISFAGKYMACQCDPASSTCGCEGGINCKGCSCCSSGHQLYRIQMPSTEAYQYGPAFIEVENQSGLSNFIPILISDSEVCCEMRMIQQRVDESLLTEGLQFPGVYVQDSCESFAMRGATLSDFVVDIAWLLKEPASENLHHILPVSQIRRFTCLLQFLTQHESTIILQKILRNLNVLMDNAKSSMELGRSGDADIRLLKQQMDQARNFLLTKQEAASSFVLSSGYTGLREQCSCQCSSRKEVVSALTITDQDMEIGESNGLRVSAGSHCLKKSECTPLLDAELAGNLLKKKPCNQVFVSSVLRSRPTLYIAAVAAVCFGVCTVLTHPHTVGDIAVSIHRSLFNLP